MKNDYSENYNMSLFDEESAQGTLESANKLDVVQMQYSCANAIYRCRIYRMEEFIFGIR